MKELSRYIIHCENNSGRNFKKILSMPTDYASFQIGNHFIIAKQKYLIYDIDIHTRNINFERKLDLISIVKVDIYCKLDSKN
ncbi:MAG: hypothetical protein Q8O84_03795 [Nanoarchaeota archaeon]|nr:hypothetical protein [Nanoarchaeota archaeon]